MRGEYNQEKFHCCVIFWLPAKIYMLKLPALGWHSAGRG